MGCSRPQVSASTYPAKVEPLWVSRPQGPHAVDVSGLAGVEPGLLDGQDVCGLVLHGAAVANFNVGCRLPPYELRKPQSGASTIRPDGICARSRMATRDGAATQRTTLGAVGRCSRGEIRQRINQDDFRLF